MKRHYCSAPHCRRPVTHVLVLSGEPDLYLCDQHAANASAGIRDLVRATGRKAGIPDGP